MKLSRNYVTPFISLIFLVVGLSGMLMFFHVFDGYTEVVHEYLGVFFVICAIFHIVLNWNALRRHFKKGVFIPAALGVLIVSVIFVVLELNNRPIDLVLMDKLIEAPISDAFKVLEIDSTEAAKRLELNGKSIDGAKSIEDIWINNESDPEEVLDLIMK